jgi:hypothetical protein
MTAILKRNLARLATVSLVAGLCATQSWAQFSSSIEGTITDPSNAALVGTSVNLVNAETGIKTTVQSNSAGYFLFPSLPAGMFNLTAAAAGFRTEEVSAIRLESGTRRTVNVSLEVGSQATILTVKAEVAAVDLADAKGSRRHRAQTTGRASDSRPEFHGIGELDARRDRNDRRQRHLPG